MPVRFAQTFAMKTGIRPDNRPPYDVQSAAMMCTSAMKCKAADQLTSVHRMVRFRRPSLHFSFPLSEITMADAKVPPSAHRLDQAVEMRRRGSTWEAVAERLHCSAETVRKWPLYYPELWQTAIRRTHAQMADATEGEVIHTLRSLLQDGERKYRWQAARALLALRIDRLKRDLVGQTRSVGAAGRKLPLVEKVAIIIDLLEGCPHEEVQRILLACHRFAEMQRKRASNGEEPVRPILA